MLFNEPKLLKFCKPRRHQARTPEVSVLFNEPKLLKYNSTERISACHQVSFSALQRAEIAEMRRSATAPCRRALVSVLFNEPKLLKFARARVLVKNVVCFSALQRAEIAEIVAVPSGGRKQHLVSVLFNEPKLLKSKVLAALAEATNMFQCSSTSRNC